MSYRSFARVVLSPAIRSLLSRWSQSPSSFATLDDNFPIVFLSSVGLALLADPPSLGKLWKILICVLLRPGGSLAHSISQLSICFIVCRISFYLFRDPSSKGGPKGPHLPLKVYIPTQMVRYATFEVNKC